jgi:hypothetical protein
MFISGLFLLRFGLGARAMLCWGDSELVMVGWLVDMQANKRGETDRYVRARPKNGNLSWKIG